MLYFLYMAAPRIRLREVQESDVPLLAQWTTDLAVMKHVTNGQTFGLKKEWEWFHTMQADADERTFAITLIEDNRLIGTCGIHNVRNSQEVGCGILIGDKHEWGKGYGTEAMQMLATYARDILKVKRIWLNVDANHTGAIRAYEKAGFRISETHENSERLHSDGREHVMEIIFS